MARILFFAILAMCLVCLLQASPVPDQNQQPSVLDQVENTLQTIGDTIKKTAESIANDPTLKKIGEDALRLVAQGADAVRERAEKAIPKTQ